MLSPKRGSHKKIVIVVVIDGKKEVTSNLQFAIFVPDFLLI